MYRELNKFRGATLLKAVERLDWFTDARGGVNTLTVKQSLKEMD